MYLRSQQEARADYSALHQGGGRGTAPRCEIVRTITRSWYQSQVWMTQFVDLADEDELPEAAEALNEELLESPQSIQRPESEEITNCFL